MIFSCVVMACLWALIRHTSQQVSPSIIVFYRTVFGLVFLVPFFLRHGRAALATSRFSMHLVRAACAVAALYSTFYAVSMAPLSDVTAISYGAPLFATLGAVVLLGERVRARRIATLIIGFVGMLVVLRPSPDRLTPGILMAVVAALAIGSSLLAIKVLARTEDPRTIVAYSFLLVLPVTFLGALPHWIWPTPEQLGLLALVGLGAHLAQSGLTRAFAYGEATAVLPFDFIRLVLAAILGAVLFAEPLDAWTGVGAGIILLATVYLAHREARQARVERA